MVIARNFLFMVCLVFAVASATASEMEDRIVAKVNGHPIRESEVMAAMPVVGKEMPPVLEEQHRRAAVDRLIDMRLIVDQAIKDELDSSEDFKLRLDLLRQQLLISEYVRTRIAVDIGEETLKERYQESIAKSSPIEEWRARHILVGTKEEADAIISELGNGAEFAKLAEDRSLDVVSAEQGGDLGYFTSGVMVEAFEEAVVKIEVGKYTSEPVETNFGFHVIKVEDKRIQTPPSFEQVKERLREEMITELFAETLAQLREKAEVEINESSTEITESSVKS